MINRCSYRLRLFRWLEQPPMTPSRSPAHPILTSSWSLTVEVISTLTLSGRGERMRASGPLQCGVRRPRLPPRLAQTAQHDVGHYANR
jgi:hypothetical protein